MSLDSLILTLKMSLDPYSTFALASQTLNQNPESIPNFKSEHRFN